MAKRSDIEKTDEVVNPSLMTFVEQVALDAAHTSGLLVARAEAHLKELLGTGASAVTEE